LISATDTDSLSAVGCHVNRTSVRHCTSRSYCVFRVYRPRVREYGVAAGSFTVRRTRTTVARNRVPWATLCVCVCVCVCVCRAVALYFVGRSLLKVVVSGRGRFVIRGLPSGRRFIGPCRYGYAVFTWIGASRCLRRRRPPIRSSVV